MHGIATGVPNAKRPNIDATAAGRPKRALAEYQEHYGPTLAAVLLPVITSVAPEYQSHLIIDIG
jgi:hypothetical protein